MILHTHFPPYATVLWSFFRGHAFAPLSPSEIYPEEHTSSIFRQSSNPVSGSWRAKPVIHGPNSTEPNLFHHGETTNWVGGMSEYATGMLLRIDLCSPSVFQIRTDGRTRRTKFCPLFVLSSAPKSASCCLNQSVTALSLTP